MPVARRTSAQCLLHIAGCRTLGACMEGHDLVCRINCYRLSDLPLIHRKVPVQRHRSNIVSPGHTQQLGPGILDALPRKGCQACQAEVSHDLTIYSLHDDEQDLTTLNHEGIQLYCVDYQITVSFSRIRKPCSTTLPAVFRE